MLLLSKYLNLSLMKPFSSRKSKYLTMSCSDLIGTETVEVLLVILEVILVTYKNAFLRETENIFVEILLPKTKPQIVGIIYRPPNQSNFFEIIITNFDKLDTDMKESKYLGDFNINMYQNNKDIVNTISSKFLSSNIKNYHQFCTMHVLKHQLKSLTHVTCSISSLTDHILASFPSRFSQKGVIDAGISDHQLIFLTQKILLLKIGGIHECLNFHSFYNYTVC